MTTPREDANTCRRHDWSAGHDYRGFQWVAATVCRRCGAVKAPSTTPREDAIAAEVERFLYDLGGDPTPEQQNARRSRLRKMLRLAALGAEAETPDHTPWEPEDGPPGIRCTCGADWGPLGCERLGAEAASPDHAFEPMRDANDLTCSRCLRRHPSWVDLASPETAEALARAMLPLIRPVLEDIGVEETEVEWCRGFAGQLLAATMRETGR